MIDWDVAVNTGVRLVRPGPQVDLSDARQAVVQLRELSTVAAGHVREFTGMNPLEPSGPAVIVDRPGWIRANVDGFRVVLEPVLEQMGADRLKNSPAGNLTSAVGSRITGVQLGAVLSYLAGRVLGQYELFLPPDPDGSSPTGRLTLVAPNIVNTERELDVDPRDFRLWVCLHEETHRMQFTATPWLRGHVQDLMQQLLLSTEMDASDLIDRLRQAGEAVADAVRGGEGNLLTAFQTPEQNALMDRITAVMSLAEGHGDYVMDAVGPEVVPSVETIRARFQKRRQSPNPLDRVMRQLLGMDLKMKQYEEGAAFVRQVVAQVGMTEFNRVWTSSETLPSLEEIRSPSQWIERVVRPAAIAE
ncbi:zinc-dependent metalloprotease [Nocardiopsis ganjiahuensis]|uniref:zinc-dependent metalloprotease n=1 Tax=Nocardiopsis ganjiahuensis TaxID=239984 RepID=UPI0004781913|nr:zinc-dependent metalloprotease [Nocardiopsis ganjiahuensis]